MLISAEPSIQSSTLGLKVMGCKILEGFSFRNEYHGQPVSSSISMVHVSPILASKDTGMAA